MKKTETTKKTKVFEKPDSEFVKPATRLEGEITVPGDKSISHRAVIMGSIADGLTVIDGFLPGEDNLATIAAFEAMGVDIKRSGERVTIVGRGIDALQEPKNVIDAKNSGTTTRLLVGLLSSRPFFSVITGDDSLRSRPMKRVVEPLRLMGATITGRMGDTLLPLAIKGGKLKGIKYKTPIASAQLKSAILLAGLFAEGETTVIEPEKSRDHTERMFKLFGADIDFKDDSTETTLRPGKKLYGQTIKVPGDISSAAFFMVAGMIVENTELTIRNVGCNQTRTGIINILKLMGGLFTHAHPTFDPRNDLGEPTNDYVIKSVKLKGRNIDGHMLLPAIDEFPIICVAAAFAKGTTTITGAGELRVKESDRIAVMAECLTTVGVTCKELPDGIIIEGTGGNTVEGGTIDSRGDHRIAMAMAIAGLKSKNGVTINNASCVDVSFPGFFDKLRQITKN